MSERITRAENSEKLRRVEETLHSLMEDLRRTIPNNGKQPSQKTCDFSRHFDPIPTPWIQSKN